jgi:hypothetical protein
MEDVTFLLNGVQPGDPAASAQLPPLVYDEMPRLAAHRLGRRRRLDRGHLAGNRCLRRLRRRAALRLRLR